MKTLKARLPAMVAPRNDPEDSLGEFYVRRDDTNRKILERTLLI